ncbi:hypothetical protein [Moraxella lacunata]|uniref:Uncharacterized protein n=1 Tax=Moraxella lacunata TaxID=477 RepID=A0A1V4GMP4_MORLA|nr:hypothetical protein [Moraxella lacunata]OPH33907.1 hypothetical protein B5J94_12195 [Moraxella lacunata]
MKSLKILLICGAIIMNNQSFANPTNNQKLDIILTMVDDFSSMSNYSKSDLENYFNSSFDEQCENGAFNICYYTPIKTNASKYTFVDKIELRNTDKVQFLILEFSPNFEVKDFDDILTEQNYQLFGNPHPLSNFYYQKITKDCEIGIGTKLNNNNEWVIDGLGFTIDKKQL